MYTIVYIIAFPMKGGDLMRIDVNSLLEEEIGIMDFCVEGMLDRLVAKDDMWRLPWPIQVKGTISNSGGILNMKGAIAGFALLKCDRCLEPFAWPLFVNIEEEFAHEPSSDGDDLNIYEGSYLDIDDIIYNDLVLALPMKFLCTLECKGLCPECGTNLNYQRCQCEAKTDMRLIGLGEWLERNRR